MLDTFPSESSPEASKPPRLISAWTAVLQISQLPKCEVLDSLSKHLSCFEKVDLLKIFIQRPRCVEQCRPPLCLYFFIKTVFVLGGKISPQPNLPPFWWTPHSLFTGPSDFNSKVTKSLQNVICGGKWTRDWKIADVELEWRLMHR